MTAVATASVQTGLRPASSSPGFWTASPGTHGPSPPETVSMPSMIVRSIGRMPTASTVCRGTRYVGRRGEAGSTSWGRPSAGRSSPVWKIAMRAEVLCSFGSCWE